MQPPFFLHGRGSCSYGYVRSLYRICTTAMSRGGHCLQSYQSWRAPWRSTQGSAATALRATNESGSFDEHLTALQITSYNETCVREEAGKDAGGASFGTAPGVRRKMRSASGWKTRSSGPAGHAANRQAACGGRASLRQNRYSYVQVKGSRRNSAKRALARP